jgi:hypothetical protein
MSHLSVGKSQGTLVFHIPADPLNWIRKPLNFKKQAQ